MRYYKLLYDYEHDHDAIMLEIDEKSLGFDRYDAERGKRFDAWNEDITFHIDTTQGLRITDYIANNLVWFLVTGKFRQILDNIASGSIQFLPVRVSNGGGNIGLAECYLANITSLIDALDLGNSEYFYIDTDNKEKVLSVVKFALKRSRIPDIDIFRIQDDYFSIFVSETIKKTVKKNGITGCDFLEVKVF